MGCSTGTAGAGWLVGGDVLDRISATVHARVLTTKYPCRCAACTSPRKSGSAATLRRYLQRRAELGLDCHDGAWLIVDLEGKPFSADRLQAHYEAARTMRVALEANGSFCRALVSLRHLAGAASSGREPQERETCTVTTGTTSS